jgi:hypothetical protein
MPGPEGQLAKRCVCEGGRYGLGGGRALFRVIGSPSVCMGTGIIVLGVALRYRVRGVLWCSCDGMVGGCSQLIFTFRSLEKPSRHAQQGCQVL